MKVVGRESVEKYLKQNSCIRTDIDLWLFETAIAQWDSFKDIQKKYFSAIYLDNNIVLFKLLQSKCLLNTKVSFINKVVLIKDINSLEII